MNEWIRERVILDQCKPSQCCQLTQCTNNSGHTRRRRKTWEMSDVMLASNDETDSIQHRFHTYEVTIIVWNACISFQKQGKMLIRYKILNIIIITITLLLHIYVRSSSAVARKEGTGAANCFCFTISIHCRRWRSLLFLLFHWNGLNCKEERKKGSWNHALFCFL